MRISFLWGIIICSLWSCKTQNLWQESRRNLKKQETKIDSVFMFDPCYEYTIKKDDKISISVWGQDEWSIGSTFGIYNSNEVYGKWLMVDINGNIEVPKIGSICVEGFSVAGLKGFLEEKFSKWLTKPIVDVKVLNKEITVLGEVRNPGIIKIDKDNNSLFEMIAKSGGFGDYANLKWVKVMRQEDEHVRLANLDLSYQGDYYLQNIQLRSGDIVVVPSKGHKNFDKRIGTLLPFTSIATAAAVLIGTF